MPHTVILVNFIFGQIVDTKKGKITFKIITNYFDQPELWTVAGFSLGAGGPAANLSKSWSSASLDIPSMSANSIIWCFMDSVSSHGPNLKIFDKIGPQLVYAVANTQKILNCVSIKSITYQWFYT